MSGASTIRAFVGRLGRMARAAGVDAERLVDEVTDHLMEATARHRLAGLEPGEAERKAIEEFGTAETLVSEAAACRKGAIMTSKSRVLGILAMLLATAVLAIAHIVPSDSAPGPARVWISGSALVVIALGLAVLAATSRWRIPVAASKWWVVAWASTTALGVLAAWEGGRIDVGFIHVSGGGRAYLGAVAALVLLIVVAARALGRRAVGGFALLLAGAASLPFVGVWGGGWRPLGSIGEGRANMGVELILVGWILVAMSWLTSARAAGARERVGAWLVSLGHRLSPPDGTLVPSPGLTEGASPGGIP